MTDLLDLSDHSKSVAFECLTKAQNDNEITEEMQTLYESKYSKLFDVVLRIYDKETVLKKRAQVLAQEKDGLEHDIRHNDEVKQENEQKIHELQEDVQKLTLELAETKEQHISIDIEKKDLENQLESVSKQIETTKRLATDQYMPHINTVTAEIRDLETSIEKQQLVLQKQLAEATKVQQETQDLIDTKEKLDEELVKKKTNFTKAKGEPERLRHNAEQYEQAVAALVADRDSAKYRLLAKQTDVNKLRQQETQKLDEIRQREKEVERLIADVEQKKASLGIIKTEIQECKHEIAQEQMNRLPLDESLQQEQEDLRVVTEELGAMQRQRNIEAQRLQLSEKEQQKAETTLQQIKATIQRVTKELQQAKQEGVKIQQATYQREDEISAKLKQITEDDRRMILGDEIAEVESEVKREGEVLTGLKRKLMDMQQDANKLRQERNLLIRKVAQVKEDALKEEEAVKMADIDIMFLKKKAESIQKKTQSIIKQTEIVKLERNKYMGAIQEAVQVLAEYREKIKILENEKETLRNEDFIKQKNLIDTRLNVQSQVNTRDTELRKLNEYIQKDRDIKAVIDQQIGEMDKLNSHVNTIEAEMLRLKKEFEYQVEQRNYTGIQLIQRNDELCIHYEKLNVQDTIAQRGLSELAKREEELSTLKLEAQELVRQVAAREKEVPKIGQQLQKLTTLQDELAGLRKRSSDLSIQLESPSNTKRWRTLGGELPSKEKLLEQLAKLEERYNSKKEKILEREIVMDEVSSHSEQLSKTAQAYHDSEAAEILSTMNQLQAKMRRVNRQLQAELSELAICQTRAKKAEEERDDLELRLEDARVNLEKGLPPTEEAEKKWMQIVRMRQEEMERKMTEIPEPPVGEVRTTAPPRYNAYVPDDGLGLPVPYSGTFQQFKPTEPGSNMRFFKNPKKKPAIQL
ncbi:putative coiled-coil flagellar protein [Monocercomonoides exilis]|uniref:putative coiled-coil flagellar protein n=1 Tax=Monocercomonoides exilis TaxID=2049356 RepID=UPI00355A12E5|nr:putative coiled-coil flagellar protein [Monocercomonoides exilis]|eukprot:MONOS_205.1-p1 / transcript=MONOS_205.1 / gene=MONOS_205 / organism=Monocercomonoides_exilis_PA203 / gene_product=coiled-coil flagellar protein, putative / transcript_product=coiled-coil flagellar protein, putative / location=Mono_scaffold00003:250777-255497(+) / protein_length=919 / sequence_SO=supercontig / SO=protein_coding / is_pseudo=false